MNTMDKLCALLKFLDLGKSIVVNNGIKIFMKSDKKLYKQKYNKKEKKYNPSYNELLKLATSIDDNIYNKIVNIIDNGGEENNE